jgi:hypothetical protein
MGIVYFPNLPAPGPAERSTPTDDPSACVNTDAMVAPASMDDVQRWLLPQSFDTLDVYGGRPTQVAYSVAVEALRNSYTPGNNYIVLITDGEPTYGAGCVGDGTETAENVKPAYIADTVDAIERAENVSPPNVPVGTFVIGLPGSEGDYQGAEARSWLSRAAEKGGTAPSGCDSDGPNYCHYDLTDPSVSLEGALERALNAITGTVVACEYFPPYVPAGETFDPSQFSVRFIDGSKAVFIVPEVTEADCQAGDQGWYWTENRDRVRLCSSTCGTVRSDPLAGMELVYGCAAAGPLML